MQKPQLTLQEKVSYALGDAAANLVWRGALAYLAVFYTDTFGISASAAALLFLVVRLSDGITDIIMGMIADRTNSRWGKFRPWIFISTPFLGLFMVLCFTTPDWSEQDKLIYAYVTYIGLTLAYTFNNVPYSALMGVMTSSDVERTSLSGFRFAGAFLGGLFVMGFLPDMVAYFGNGNDAQGYQYSMYVFSGILMFLMLVTVVGTKERVNCVSSSSLPLSREITDLCKQLPFILLPLLAITLFFYYRSLPTFGFLIAVGISTTWVIKKLLHQPDEQRSRAQQDMVDLLMNKPWLILLAMGFLTMMFNGIKYGVIAYYFKYFIGDELLAGKYFVALLVVSVVGALCTEFFVKLWGRKYVFIIALLASAILTSALYWVGADQIGLLFILGCAAEFFAAMMPTLFFSMLGDAADYSEWKTGRRATGLVYSAGTFVQKTGGGFAGALVLVVLASYGYNGMDPVTTTHAVPGMLLLMSFIPSLFAVIGACVMLAYPIDSQMQSKMTADLISRREHFMP
ncbi:MFS transporter [Alteromonas sediminis]|uniref:MFS transporter n=1 Tax=Alteromonas sediminis TaxID=2259342 RepID=A0A3N5Y408_9ALTE|nr:MFS transporter [Alteromonas sediminis]RPJ68150.1 MFS transporter [Alteromonas sediminis]